MRGRNQHLAVASALGEKVLLTDGNLTDGDTVAVAVVAVGLDHVVAARVDNDVVDVAEAAAVEHEITGLLGREIDDSGGLGVLVGGTVVDGLAASLIDTVLAQTRAVEADDVAVIAVGALLLHGTLGGTVVVATAPRVGVAADHGAHGGHDGITATVRGSESNSCNSKNHNSKAHSSSRFNKAGNKKSFTRK